MKLRNSSIARRLVLCLIFLLVPVILINVAVNIYNMMTLKEEVLDSSEILFTTLAEEVEGTLGNIQSNAYALSSDVNLKALNTNEELTPSKILKHHEQIQNLGYVARSGSLDMEINVYLLASGRVISSSGTMARFEGIDAAQAEEAGAAGIWLITQNSKKNSFMSYRYFVPSSAGGMVISMDIPAGCVKNLLESIKTNEYGSSFIVFSDGSAIGAEPGDIKGVQRLASEGGRLYIYEPDENGNILMLQPVLGGLLSICTYYSEAKIMENLWLTTVFSTLVILISAALGLLLIFLAYRVLVKPIHILVDAMKTVENNNLNIEIPLDTQDEIGFMYAQFNAMVSKLQNLINEVYLQKIYNQEMRISMYQSQINPHFLHNCLNFISQSAIANCDEYSAKMSQFLSKYFRYNIASEDLTTKVYEELDIIVAYVEIQKIRFPGRVDYSVEMDPQAREISIPKLSIQPLVENCFVHALNKMEIPLFINIDIQYNQGILKVKVSDNSGLMTKEMINDLRTAINREGNPAVHLGLSNINNRIRSMYGVKSSLEISLSEGKGLESVIIIDTGGKA